MTALLLARAHYPVLALGPGVRAGIWTQGCTIACAGCMSRDTWNADPATATPVPAVLAWLSSLPDPLDGVTISGGEPFEQPAALGELLDGILAWRGERPIDVLVYSGRPLSRLTREQRSRDILARCDAVIAGPYVERRNTGLRWRGSSNQSIVTLSPLGHRRYADADSPPEAPRLQVCVDGDRVHYIGIPRRGDLELLADRLSDAGVQSDATSWRP
ncbi:radical activating enzyme [Acrocarpospora phusangensis]|uniref:Radical activating enzyme n=1 Tax=Acrocarpospora phusangensis TaxID=1070424 RepID=A0A919Q8H3_9ACTN|nr:4Fe-4S single cluster domain-containing protein [Acrocarpospora phusangensis]GIH23466.1 radical activating enzyme [Acrocarpospora phusangensis]